MKSFEGFGYAEIKIIGKHGDKRVYGIWEGRRIYFLFLAEHSESSSDGVHNRLRLLWRRDLL